MDHQTIDQIRDYPAREERLERIITGLEQHGDQHAALAELLRLAIEQTATLQGLGALVQDLRARVDRLEAE